MYDVFNVVVIEFPIIHIKLNVQSLVVLYDSYHSFFSIAIAAMIVTMIGAMLYYHYDYQKTLLFITIATTITSTTTISIVVTMMVPL